MLTAVTPAGSVPVKLKSEAGDSGIVRMPKLLFVPTTKVVLFTLVKYGSGVTTDKVKVCVAAGATPFVAVMVKEKLAGVPESGKPTRVAVPSVLSMKESQLGSVPEVFNEAVGVPIVRTVKIDSAPTIKLVLAAVVIVGATSVGATSCTRSVNFCTAVGGMPLVAEIVMG